MAAPDTRARIIDQGLDLLSETGLAGVTLGGLAYRVGMSKSGLFAHFKSKEAVQIALLDESAKLADRVVVEPAFSVPPGLGRLRKLIESWLGWPTRAGLAGGCPIAAALFELDDLDGAVRQRVQDLEGVWRSLLAGLVKEAVVTGDFRRDLDVDQFVFELCGLYLSHHVSRRFLADPLADRRAADALDVLVARARSSG
jgi:AcrR family transcriptional regulator